LCLGLLATLNGLVGGIHYGFGRGTGSLLGGAIAAYSGSVRHAFWAFGIGALVCALIYAFYEHVVQRWCCARDSDGAVVTVATETELVTLDGKEEVRNGTDSAPAANNNVCKTTAIVETAVVATPTKSNKENGGAAPRAV
jgi:hypothetical protein